MNWRDERGQVTAFVVIITLALFLFAGLVIDGGYALAAKRRANALAEGAARAGAQALDPEILRSTGAVVLDPSLASNLASAYLEKEGYRGDVQVFDDRVLVTVHSSQPMLILGMAGLGRVSITGRGEARTVRGVGEAES